MPLAALLALVVACSNPPPSAPPEPAVTDAPTRTEAPDTDAAAPSAPADTDAAAPTGQAPADPAPPTSTAPGEPAPAAKTPADLYAECRDRVEGAGVAGECKTDADCARAGCGSEVCVAKAAAADVMTTCEMRPCFEVLDTCGCHDGQCSWTLTATAPPAARVPFPGAAPQ